MKKVLFAMMLAAGGTVAFAQQPPIPEMQPGMSDFKNWLVYGDFGYNASNNDNTANATQLKSNNWSVNPGLGYRVNEHLVVGIQGGMNASHTKVTFTGIAGYDENRTDNWTLGVFVRHNCCDMGKTFYCFSQLNVSYLGMDAYPNENFPFSSYNVTTQDQIVNGYGVQATFVPSLGVRLPHAYSLQLNLGGIGYSYLTQDHGNGTASNFSVTFAQQIHIGIAKEFNFRRSLEARAFREPDVELHSRIIENMSGDDEDGGGRRESRKSHDMDEE
jgi:hypothetical protein